MKNLATGVLAPAMSSSVVTMPGDKSCTWTCFTPACAVHDTRSTPGCQEGAEGKWSWLE